MSRMQGTTMATYQASWARSGDVARASRRPVITQMATVPPNSRVVDAPQASVDHQPRHSEIYRRRSRGDVVVGVLGQHCTERDGGEPTDVAMTGSRQRRDASLPSGYTARITVMGRTSDGR